MNYNLVINATDQGCRIALLKDKDLVEFHFEEETTEFKVGDIYLGIVKKIVPGLNAAFIDIGFEKDAFLHYLDLGSHVGPSISLSDKRFQERIILQNSIISGLSLKLINLGRSVRYSVKISRYLSRL